MTAWSNWSQHVKADPKVIARPADKAELQDLVRNGAGPIRVAGSGHSFTPLVPSEGTIVLLDNLAHLIDHDDHAVTATMGGGITLGNLTRSLQGIGQALANMGDIDKQTIGGALGTATHGTGATLGAYHTLVDGLEIVDGSGDIRRYNRKDDSSMLDALSVTLGAFGIVTEVTLRNMKSYRLRKRRFVLPIEEMLSNFEQLMTGYRSAEFYFIPHSGSAMFLGSDITDDPITSRPPEEDEDGLKTLRRLRDFLHRLPWARRKLIEGAVRKLPKEDYVEDWLNVYTSERQTRFNEIEYHLPIEEGPKALADIIALTETKFPRVYFPMEVRTVAADNVWLSPFYRRQCCSIAVHEDARENPAVFFRAVEAIFRRHGGRPHWGKMHTLTSRDLRMLYPRFDDAMEIRRELDPNNRFITPYLAQLTGAGE